MSPYYHGKKSFNREEIVDILKRNVTLYKDGPGFADYIATLSFYLVEMHHQEELEMAMRDQNAPIRVDTEGLGKTLRVSRHYAKKKRSAHCSLCGTHCTDDDKNCPNCGNPL